MAGGSVTVAALRHRPRQALLIVVLSAVVSAAASLGPLYTRAVEQSVLRTVVADAAPADRGIVVLATGGGGSARPPSPARLARLTADAGVPATFRPPVLGADTSIVLSASGRAFRAGLVSRRGLCQHLEILDGACIVDAGEVLLSQRAADATGLLVGSTVDVAAEGADADAAKPPVSTVVGIYAQPELTDPFWAGRSQVRPAAQPVGQPDDAVDVPQVIDDLLTPWSTLATGDWSQLRTHLDIALDPKLADLASIDQVAAATARLDRRLGTVQAGATSSIDDLLAASAAQRDQVRTVVPILTVQLAVLGVVVLAFVCAAAAEQRRPEIALARLRGQGAGGAGALLLRELGPLVLAGSVLGAGLGWLIAGLAVRLWLAPGVALEARWPVGVSVVAAAAVGLLAIVVASLPTLRQPVTSLLRRVPPRATALTVGLVEGAVATAAGAGVITLLAGDSGPVALLAPGLLAVAGGLLLAQAVVPTAGPAVGSLLRRGNLPTALAGAQLARRPALRRLIAIITVAVALLVFAVDAWAVSERNRVVRAEVDAGATTVLTVDVRTPDQLQRSTSRLDPQGRFSTPVVTTRSAAPVGPMTLAVNAEAFARIAHWQPASARPARTQIAALTPTTVDPVDLPAANDLRIEVAAQFALTKLQRPPGFQGNLKPVRLSLLVTGPDGTEQFVELGQLRRGGRTYDGIAACPQGCSLSGFLLERTFGDSYPVDISLRIDEVRAGPAATGADLGPATAEAWQVAPSFSVPTGATVDPGPPLTIRDRESFQSVTLRRGTVPAVTPALRSGDLPPAFRSDPTANRDDLVVAPDTSGSDHLYAAQGRVSRVPGTTGRTVVVDLATTADRTVPTGPQTTYAVWLDTADPALVRRVRNGLADDGIAVLGADGTAAHRRALAAEGPTLALRLALLAGVIAVVLAAAVLVVGVATSGPARARDLAALRIVGVPVATIRKAAVREHLVVAVLGVLAGSALGLVAAQAALPHVPLFATAESTIPLDVRPSWAALLLTVAGCLALLATVSVVVGRALAASATVDRLRESR